MISHCSHERPLGTAAALARLRSHAEEERLVVTLDSVGTNLKTWTCRVTHDSGQTAVGRGKGIGQQGIVSAVAEALEHYWYTYEDVGHLVEIREFQFTPDAALSKASPDFALVFNDEPVTFDCLPFDSFQGAELPLYFPAILQDPGYRSLGQVERDIVGRSRLFRYATNSGTAAGLTPDDACLHGLLESIERDAIGITLLRSVISQSPIPVRRIDLASLPADLKQLVSLLGTEADACSIELWDITSDVAVPTILCGLTVEAATGRYRYFGSGSSLLAEYATERALLESLQGFHIHQQLKDFEQATWKSGDAEKLSLYRRCEMDAGYFEYRAGEHLVDFSSVPTYSPMQIPEQLLFLVQRLTAVGCPPFRRNVYCSAEVSVSQVIVPNLERFYLVARGISVAPSWRGRRQMAKLT